jgi:WD40 repeat protein
MKVLKALVLDAFGKTARIICAVLILLLGFGPHATRAQSTEGQNWQVLRTLTGHMGGVNSVAFSPDSKRALSASSARGDGFRFWDLATGQTLECHWGSSRGYVHRVFAGQQACALGE